MHTQFMRRAIELSRANINSNGGPFGAVIVKNGHIVGEGVNRVTATNDPTAHAEIVAIRNACKNLTTFNLSECTIYTSCEPCPMCLSAIYWARIKQIYYANTKDDAALIGFSDAFIYQELALTPANRQISSHQIAIEDAKIVFSLWQEKKDKMPY